MVMTTPDPSRTLRAWVPVLCLYACVCTYVCVCRIFEKTYKKIGRRKEKKRQQNNFECACVRERQDGGLVAQQQQSERGRRRESKKNPANQAHIMLRNAPKWRYRSSRARTATQAQTGNDSYKWPAGSSRGGAVLSLSLCLLPTGRVADSSLSLHSVCTGISFARSSLPQLSLSLVSLPQRPCVALFSSAAAAY